MPRTLKKKYIKYGPKEKVVICGLGDIHLGAIDVDRDLLLEDVERIRTTPNCYWLGTGDFLETIDHDDPRYQPGMHEPAYHDADRMPGGMHTHGVEDVSEILEPIKDQCIGMGNGNHEAKLWKRQNRDLVSEIAANLGLSDLLLGYTGWVPLGFIRTSAAGKHNGQTAFSMNIHFHHGKTGGQNLGAFITATAKEKAFKTEADILMRGHGHQSGGQIFTDQRPDGTSKEWVVVQTGTYKLGDSLDADYSPEIPYEVMANYGPKSRATMGSPSIVITPSPKTKGVKRPYELGMFVGRGY